MSKRELWQNIYFTIIDNLYMLDFCLFKKNEMKKILKENKKYKNIHNGKRCFILGNGPSMKEQNLSMLENEIVFGVNQCSRNVQYPFVKLNYYVCVDPVFFNLNMNNKGDVEVLQTFKDLNVEGNKPVCFIPYEYKALFAEKYGLNKILNINYIEPKLYFRENEKWKLNLEQYVYNFGTVVQYAITIAIFMGFKEIYLLGCDNTGIIVTLNSLLQSSFDTDYVYLVTENEKERIRRMVNEKPLEWYAEGYAQTLKDYRRLYKYCRERNIKLVNCSKKTVIDSIPRMHLEEVLELE